MSYSFPEELFIKLLDYPGIALFCDHLIGLLGDSIQSRCRVTPHCCKLCIGVDKKKKVCKHPYIGILFSGGIDCTLIAMLADQYIDEDVPIDLLNVSFEKINSPSVNYDTPDRISARASLQELQKLCPNR